MRGYIISTCLVVAVIILSVLFLGKFNERNEWAFDDEQTKLDEQIVIRFSHVVAENTPKGIAATKFAQLIEEKSDGEILVQVSPNGLLYNDESELQAVRTGKVEMIAPTASKVSAILPNWQVLDLPFIVEDVDQMYSLLHGTLSEQLLAELTPMNVKGLTFWSNGMKQMASSKSELVRVEQFQQVTVRTMDSETLKKQFSLLGAVPIVTTFNDLYTAAASNKVEAQENTLSNLVSKRFTQLQPYITLSNHGLLAYSVMINEEFWQRLSQPQQKIIEEALAEMSEWQHQQAVAQNLQELAWIKQQKQLHIATLTELERKQWQDKLNPLYERYQHEINKDYFAQLLKETQ